MKKQLIWVAVIFSCVLTPSITFGQTEELNKEQTAPLTYEATPSAKNTYTVIRNVNSVQISEEINLQMNLHRRFDKPYIWKVSDELWILLYPFNYKPQNNNHETE